MASGKRHVFLSLVLDISRYLERIKCPGNEDTPAPIYHLESNIEDDCSNPRLDDVVPLLDLDVLA